MQTQLTDMQTQLNSVENGQLSMKPQLDGMENGQLSMNNKLDLITQLLQKPGN